MRAQKAMTEHLLPGEPPIRLLLRRSARARRISLRVSGLDGRVTLTVPPRVPEREALSFASEKQDWLRRQLQSRPDKVELAVGGMIPFRGTLFEIQLGQGRAVRCVGNQILVPGKAESVRARLAGFFKTSARERLAEASDRHAARLGRDYAKITLRDTRSRWGSCNSQGALMYSWRLIMAPPAVLDYVAAHEVAHLVEMNHSPAFWHKVEMLYGDTTSARAWLREEGVGLHRYQF